MKTNIVILAMVVMVISLSMPCLAEGRSETNPADSLAHEALQSDVRRIEETGERIGKKLEGLEKSNAAVNNKLDKLEKTGQKAEENLKQQIKDTEENLKKANSASVDSLEKKINRSQQRTKQALEEKIDKSNAETKESLGRMEKVLNGIRGNLRVALYLVVALLIVSALVYGVVLLLKRRPKNIWMTIDKVMVDGAERTYEVLVKYHRGIYTSPFKTESGKPICKDDFQDMKSSLRNCLKKSGNGGMFEKQREGLTREGRIKEIS